MPLRPVWNYEGAAKNNLKEFGIKNKVKYKDKFSKKKIRKRKRKLEQKRLMK